MKHYLVREYQNCYVEYLVGADSVGDARAKAKEVHDDAIEIVNSPIYIDSTKYTVKGLDKKDEDDPVVAEAIKRIDKNYEPEEIERKKKLRRTPRKKKKSTVKATTKRKSRKQAELDEAVDYINGCK